MHQSAPTELLPALLALLETESVTLAARRLHVGQPAMSRTLERLRNALGDELLVRSGRNLVRTRRADALLPDVRDALFAAERVLSRAEAFVPRAARGAVTLSLGDDMQAIVALPLLEQLRARAPMLDVRIRPFSEGTAREALRGVVDVVVLPDLRGQYDIPGLDEIVLAPQYTRRFVVVSRAREKLALRRFLEREHVLVSPRGDEGGYVDDALRAEGLARRVAVTVPSFQAALALVARSDLVATLPDDVTRMLAPSLYAQVCPVPTPELPICVAWAARFASDERHAWLRAQVIEVMREVGRPASSPRRANRVR